MKCKMGLVIKQIELVAMLTQWVSSVISRETISNQLYSIRMAKIVGVKPSQLVFNDVLSILGQKAHIQIALDVR